MSRIVTFAAIALAAVACGPAVAHLGSEQVGLSGRDAHLEARTAARSWDADARLRWVEGIDIAPSGLALPEAGHWRFHYTAPGRTTGLVVAVGPRGAETTEGPPGAPPGVAIGSGELTGTWIDSPEALRAAVSARGGSAPARASLLLVPAQPTHWVIGFPEADARRWRVDAATGEVLDS